MGIFIQRKVVNVALLRKRQRFGNYMVQNFELDGSRCKNGKMEKVYYRDWGQNKD